MSDDKVLVSREFLKQVEDLLACPQSHVRSEYIAAYEELTNLLAQPSDGALTNERAEPVAWECDDSAGDTGRVLVTNDPAVRDEWVRQELPVCPLFGPASTESRS